VFFLTGAGADRDAAQLWFELADLLEDVGDLDAAREAYRSAAASIGLRSRTRSRVSVS
jgi:Tfp pilus assembly protein PilF